MSLALRCEVKSFELSGNKLNHFPWFFIFWFKGLTFRK